MTKHLCCFSDSRMTIAQDKLVASARQYGINCHVWRETDLSREFWDFNKDLLQQERGFGFYVWKPYVVLQTILKLSEGDILIYADAGNEFINDPQLLIDAMDQDIMFFSNGWHHAHWCKRETANAIHGDIAVHDSSFITDGYGKYKQVQASTFVIKVTQKTIDFVKEWYAYSCVPGLIDNICRGNQFPQFQEHRWDQAILTCLQIKYNYKLHWFPSMYGYHIKDQHPEDRYPEMLNHHRKRNNEW